jgi:chorismate dehydratase
MTRPLRLGAVGYLNARPLVYGLERDPRFTVRYDVPSRCATRLHDGEIDLGLVPSIEFLRGDYRIVPEVAVASEGPVESVAVYSRRPLSEVRSIALDTSSRTSAALLEVLCAERFGIAPDFVPHGPDLAAMLDRCDGALLIGDPALWADHAGLGLRKVDLGDAWTAHTGLPFVWACWVGRPGAVDPAGVEALVAARDRGVEAIDTIAAAHTGGEAARAARAARYLRHNIRFHLRERHVEGLRRFYASASRLGLVPGGAGGPAFFDRAREPVRM